MSTDDADRRAAVVTRLESLQFEVDVEILYIGQSMERTGRTTLIVSAAPWPNEWPFDGCRELWQASAPLVRNGRFDETEADGGLARWLLTYAQPFVNPVGSAAHLANPIKVWLDAVRNPDAGPPVLDCTKLVPGDPRLATAEDLAHVAAKARLLVGLLEKEHEDFARLERSIQTLRPKHGETLRPDEERYLKMQFRSLRWERWNWCEWCIYADIVSHYASALLPEVHSECRHVANRVWHRLNDKIDWPELDREFHLLANKLQWHPPAATGAVHSVAVNSDEQNSAERSGTMLANTKKLRRSLTSAREELALARERATTFEELSVRSWRAVVQACHALHADVWIDVQSISHSPFWGLMKTRPGEWSDSAAFNWWNSDICPWVRSTSTVWAGSAGQYDFSPPLRNEAGKLVDRDGNELKYETLPDGSVRLSGKPVTQMQIEDESKQMIRMQLRSKDWLDVIDRLIEMIDEQPIENGDAVPSANPVGEGAPGNRANGGQTGDGTRLDDETSATLPEQVTRIDSTTPPAELLHELTPQQGKIVTHLWNAKHATNWQSLPDDCWRNGRSTSDQTDRAIESALERLRDRLNKLAQFGLTLEVHTGTTKLLHKPPRK